MTISRDSDGLTSWKKTLASCPYSGDLKAKSMSKVSQQLSGVGPPANSQVVCRCSNRVLSETRDMTFAGSSMVTSEVYLHECVPCEQVRWPGHGVGEAHGQVMLRSMCTFAHADSVLWAALGPCGGDGVRDSATLCELHGRLPADAWQISAAAGNNTAPLSGSVVGR